jgi:hypothetical protein
VSHTDSIGKSALPVDIHQYFADKQIFVVEEPEASAATRTRTLAGIDRLIQITKAKERDSRMSEHQPVGDNKLAVRTPIYIIGVTKYGGQEKG